MNVSNLIPDLHALRSPRTMGDVGLTAGLGVVAVANAPSWQIGLTFAGTVLVFLTQLLKVKGEQSGIARSIRAEIAALREGEIAGLENENRALKEQNADQQRQLDALKRAKP